MSGPFDLPGSGDGANLKGFDDFELLLGDIMRGERATLGKSLLDVQRELKIKASYIAAIENTDPTAFETPGFIAGYVRSYARYLGLDPEWAFRTFCEEGNYEVQHGMAADASLVRTPRTARSEPGQKSPRAAATPAYKRDPFTEPSVSYLPKGEAMFTGIEPRAIGSIMILCLLVAGIGYGGWSVLQEVQKVRFAPVEQTPGVLSQLDPLAPPEETAEPVETAEVTTPDESETFSRLYRPEALDVPVLVSRDGPIAAIDPSTFGALAPEGEERPITARAVRPDTAPFATPGMAPSDLPVREEETTFARLDTDDLLPAPQVLEATRPAVSLLAVRPSWVRVRGGDGTVIFEKILDAGEEFEVPLTEEPAILRAGNAGSLYFAVNGMTYGPAGDGPEVIKNVILEPTALQETYAVANIEEDSDLARFVAVAEAQSTESE